MEAIISNFRGGRHTQTGNHMIIVVNSITSKDKAAPLVGKKVTWKNAQGTTISGKIAAAHGNKGAIRAIFERGMPGQSIGTKVVIE